MASLTEGQAYPLLLFDLHHVHNRGAAFGIMQSGGLVFVVVALIVLAAVFVLNAQIRRSGPAEGANALFVDGIHPSSRGHALLADALLPVVRERLAQSLP